MALIKCPECGREISDAAHSCPGCGYPIAEKLAGTMPEQAQKSEASINRPAPLPTETVPPKADRGWIGLVVIAAVFVILAVIAVTIIAGAKSEKHASAATPAPIETVVPIDTPEPTAAPTSLPHISWTKQYYVDDFNDPTDESYIRGHFKGTFSNSATSGSKLDVYFYVDHDMSTPSRQNDSFHIRLFEYGDSVVTFSYTNTSEVTIKIKVDEKIYSSYASELTERDIYISRSSEIFKPFLRALMDGKEISVVIEESHYSTSTYRFKVDAYGLDDLEHNWKF